MFDANMTFGEIVQWCSYACQGNPATNKVDFIYNGEPSTMNLCDECLEKFLVNGPKK